MSQSELPYWKRTNCPTCGKPKDRKAMICIECYLKLPHSDRKPSREQLVLFLREHRGNFTQVGKLFGVTDNAVRKWCRSYGLPYRTGDYKHSL